MESQTFAERSVTVMDTLDSDRQEGIIPIRSA